MAKIIKGVSPEREAYLKGQQERGVTVRNGVSPQRQAYMDSMPNDEVIEAKPVNANRTNMMQRPLTSRIPRIGSNPLDINQIRGVASDMVNNGNYQHPEYKAKLQAMFPKPKLALGGIVNANQSVWNESYKQRPDMFHDNLSFDNMTTDGTDNASSFEPKQTKISLPNALALKENRAPSGFDNMTTDGYKKGGVVKKPTETNRQRLGAINYKEGGTIKGPGTGTSDSIDANLPIGSAVIPASVLKLYGEDFFDKLEAVAHASMAGEESKEPEHMPMAKPKLGMKCGGIAKMKDGGIVPAKVSNGERYLTPEAVKFFGKKFVNTLIHASPSDVKEEMGEVKGGKIYAARGDSSILKDESGLPKIPKTDTRLQEIINKNTGVKSPVYESGVPTPLQKIPVITQPEPQWSEYNSNPANKQLVPSNKEFIKPVNATIDSSSIQKQVGTNWAKPNPTGLQIIPSENAKVYMNQPKGRMGPQKPLGTGNTSAQAHEFINRPAFEGTGEARTSRASSSFDGGTKKVLGMAGKSLGVGLLPNAIDAMTGGAPEDLAVVNENNAIYNKQGGGLAGVKGVIGNEYDKFTNRNREIANSLGFGQKENANINPASSGFSNIPTPPYTAFELSNSGTSPRSDNPVMSIRKPRIGNTYLDQSQQVNPNATLDQATKTVKSPITMINANTAEPINPPVSAKQSMQPYSTRLGNMGDKVNTLDVTNGQGGTGRVQFADGRTLMPEQTDYLKGELARNADPAFQARLAEQAQIVNDRMAWAKQNDLERNARLGNAAAANTLKAQADTKQAQLAAQVEANKLGYNKEADADKLAQEKELKGRELDIQENKPITIDERNPEGLVIGTKVLGKTKDKEGKVSYNNLAQNATDKDAEVMQSLSPEERTDMYNNSILTLQDKKIKPTDPKYKASINFLRLHDLLFQQPAA